MTCRLPFTTPSHEPSMATSHTSHTSDFVSERNLIHPCSGCGASVIDSHHPRQATPHVRVPLIGGWSRTQSWPLFSDVCLRKTRWRGVEILTLFAFDGRFNEMTAVELRYELKKKGLRTAGNKNEMLDRLMHPKEGGESVKPTISSCSGDRCDGRTSHNFR